MELAEYAKEGIDGAKITYDDNQPLLDLMLDKRGLISILDEEVQKGPHLWCTTLLRFCCFPSSTTAIASHRRPRTLY